MDVSPKTLREVEFREKMRGYHPEDVDQFLEQVAAGLEVIQDRLRQAVERAQRAEAAAASDSGGANDETLRRTLVLAQRTADLAVQEAREQAARILAVAEQQAQTLLAETDDRARRNREEALGSTRSELAQMEASRQRAQAEIDAMHRWIDDHRIHLTASLKDALSAVERAGAVSVPPSSTPIDLPRPPAAQPPAAGPSQAGQPHSGTPQPATPQTGSVATTAPVSQAVPATGAPSNPGTSGNPLTGAVALHGGPAGDRPGDVGPRTAMWDPASEFSEPTGEVPAVPGGRRAIIDVDAGGHDDRAAQAEEQALDDFFDDGDFAGADGRRFGSRLRRRR